MDEEICFLKQVTKFKIEVTDFAHLDVKNECCAQLEPIENAKSN